MNCEHDKIAVGDICPGCGSYRGPAGVWVQTYLCSKHGIRVKSCTCCKPDNAAKLWQPVIAAGSAGDEGERKRSIWEAVQAAGRR